MKDLNLPLITGLMQYKNEEILRFHMPGHFGRMPQEYEEIRQNLFALDVTEVDGTDNLATPKGIIKHSLKNIAEIYGAKRSFYLVNGSTVGIHIAIDSLVADGGTMLLARNAHKSVHNIVTRKNIKPIYAYPEVDKHFGVDGEMTIEEIRGAVASNKRIDAVLLTYPNYYGKAYDLAAIHKFLKQKQIPLIIDAAHGAHFEFSADLPDSPVHHSDVCIMSLHKTIPAFTQCSVLHIGQEIERHFENNIADNTRIYQTTSPSYLLMSASELSVAIMNTKGRTSLQRVQQFYMAAKKELEKHPSIDVYKSDDFCKLFVRTPLKGKTLSKILRREYKIQAEMDIGNGLLFMLGITHTAQDMSYLVQSVIDAVDKTCAADHETAENIDDNIHADQATMFPRLETIPMELQKAIIKQSYLAAKKYSVAEIPLSQAEGKVIAEDIIPYPPGIPVIKRFEIINQEAIATLARFGYTAIQYYVL